MKAQTASEATEKRCPFIENGTVNCLAHGCMAWVETKDYEDQPVGLEPPGSEWEKSGPARGEGGAVTSYPVVLMGQDDRYRQTWERIVGFCARLYR